MSARSVRASRSDQPGPVHGRNDRGAGAVPTLVLLLRLGHFLRRRAGARGHRDGTDRQRGGTTADLRCAARVTGRTARLPRPPPRLHVIKQVRTVRDALRARRGTRRSARGRGTRRRTRGRTRLRRARRGARGRTRSRRARGGTAARLLPEAAPQAVQQTRFGAAVGRGRGTVRAPAAGTDHDRGGRRHRGWHRVRPGQGSRGHEQESGVHGGDLLDEGRV